jgi:hypothetical protein
LAPQVNWAAAGHFYMPFVLSMNSFLFQISLLLLGTLALSTASSSPYPSYSVEFSSPPVQTEISSLPSPSFLPLEKFSGRSHYITGIPYWNQNDPRWGNISYFQSGPNHNWTIGSVGCALTSICMAATFATGNLAFTPPFGNKNLNKVVAQLQQFNLGSFNNLWYNNSAGFLPKNSSLVPLFMNNLAWAIYFNAPVVMGFKVHSILQYNYSRSQQFGCLQ